METCNECGHQYNPPVTMPQPVPDLMCAKCATVLTPEEIANLKPPYAPTQTEGA